MAPPCAFLSSWSGFKFTPISYPTASPFLCAGSSSIHPFSALVSSQINNPHLIVSSYWPQFCQIWTQIWYFWYGYSWNLSPICSYCCCYVGTMCSPHKTLLHKRPSAPLSMCLWGLAASHLTPLQPAMKSIHPCKLWLSSHTVVCYVLWFLVSCPVFFLAQL